MSRRHAELWTPSCYVLSNGMELHLGFFGKFPGRILLRMAEFRLLLVCRIVQLKEEMWGEGFSVSKRTAVSQGRGSMFQSGAQNERLHSPGLQWGKEEEVQDSHTLKPLKYI